MNRNTGIGARDSRNRKTGFALVFGISLVVLGACDDLLEVELPHILTDAALEGPDTAETQINSAIALFECGWSAFALHALGHEDVLESIAGAGSGLSRFQDTPSTGLCDTSSQDYSWFDQIAGARALLSNAPERLVSTAQGTGRGVYDRMEDEWDLGADEERLKAVAAVYMAATLDHFGEFVCESALDGSDLITPTEMLNLAEAWADRALGHISNFGDFAMPHGIATSARTMATGLRARIRWANGDLAGAAADAAMVPDGFFAYVTRETGEQRRNKTYHAARSIGFGGMLGINDWWTPEIRDPNPATGQRWPNPIPFTGYLFLGIMPDGRALEPGNLPVVTAEVQRDLGNEPTFLDTEAVRDTRVQHIKKAIQGPDEEWVPDNYKAEDDDEPLVSWEEMRFIEAELALSQGNLQRAIDIVNNFRRAAELPVISGDYEASLLADREQVRYMLVEERRRELFASGARYYAFKIQNTDLLWFPRRQGDTPFQGYPLLGAVRFLFASDEYETNPYFVERGGRDARATGCTSLPGSQAPVPS